MAENVQVAVRMRPFNAREIELNCTCCIKIMKETQQTIIVDPETNLEKTFTFDYSYDSFVPPTDPAYASQETVWNDIGVLEHAWNGFNVSLFAYGQTGSGKSYSMVGYGRDKGIIPKASEQIFQRIHDSMSSNLSFKVEASMMEIYNERVKDLFNPSSDNLKVRDHPIQGPYAEGLTRGAVTSHKEIRAMMEAGILARTTASTNMNATSSRAHTIFQIILTQLEIHEDLEKMSEKVSRINLIDLAGSERAESTGATGIRKKEGAAINQSLSALGNVISALADLASGKKKVLVPYRNSKLTHLLKDSLGGNSKTIMIASLSPASVNYSETLSTLRYADRAKQIRNKAIVNEDPNQMIIRQLKDELESLRRAMLENVKVGPRPGTAQLQGEGLSELEIQNRREKEELESIEREKELACIREQLEENQRLLKENEKTWQERLKETEKVAKKQEEQLKALGLAGNTEHLRERSKVEPHLLSLNEDRLLSEKVLYFLSEGSNLIGRSDADVQQSVILGGLGIHKEHCVLSLETERQSHTQEQRASNPEGTNVDNHKETTRIIIKLYIRLVDPTALAYVNAVPVKHLEAIALHHCDRLILGNSNVFRIVIPCCRRDNNEDEALCYESQYNWQFAMNEFTAKSSEQRREAEAVAEKERLEMELKVKEMEAQILQEKQAAQEKLERQRSDWENHVRTLNAQMHSKELAIKQQMIAEGEQDKKVLAEKLAAQAADLAEELAQAGLSFEKQQEEYRQKQQDLEISLQRQIKHANLQGQLKELERSERLQFDDAILRGIPIINEANLIAEELTNATTLALKFFIETIDAFALGKVPDDDIETTTLVISRSIAIQLKVSVLMKARDEYYRATWTMDKFLTRLSLMRELYQLFIQNHRSLENTLVLWEKQQSELDSGDYHKLSSNYSTDPYHEPPKIELLGNGYLYLNSLMFGCKLSDSALPIYDAQGHPSGTLQCEIVPSVLSHEWQASFHQIIEECPDSIEDIKLPQLSSFTGVDLRLTITIENVIFSSDRKCRDFVVQFYWPFSKDGILVIETEGKIPEAMQTPQLFKSHKISGPLNDTKVIFTTEVETKITESFLHYLASTPLRFEVEGIVSMSDNPHRMDGNYFQQDQESNSDTLNDQMWKEAEQAARQRRKSIKGIENQSVKRIEELECLVMSQETTLIETTHELEAKEQEVVMLQEKLHMQEEETARLHDALDVMTKQKIDLQQKLMNQITGRALNDIASGGEGLVYQPYSGLEPKSANKYSADLMEFNGDDKYSQSNREPNNETEGIPEFQLYSSTIKTKEAETSENTLWTKLSPTKRKGNSNSRNILCLIS